MTGTITTTTEIAGIEFDVEADFDASYVDNGIGAYEYWGARGVHHDWCWEVEDVYDLRFACEPEEYIKNDLEARGWWWRKWNPFYWVAVAWLYAKVMREFETLDPNDIFDDDELTEAAADQAPEPDYDRYDD